MLSYLANSRYVAYLDDDNWWADDHLSAMHARCRPAPNGPTRCVGLSIRARGGRSAGTIGNRLDLAKGISAVSAVGSIRTAWRSTRSPARPCCAGGRSRSITARGNGFGPQRVSCSQERVPRRGDRSVQRILRDQRNRLDDPHRLDVIGEQRYRSCASEIVPVIRPSRCSSAGRRRPGTSRTRRCTAGSPLPWS